MNAHTHKLTQDLFTNQHTAHHLCDLSTAQRGRDSEGLRHTHTSTSVHIQADRQTATYTRAHTRVCTPACTHAHRQTDRNSVCLSDRQKLCRRTLSVCLSVCLSDLRALPLSRPLKRARNGGHEKPSASESEYTGGSSSGIKHASAHSDKQIDRRKHKYRWM
jgi:hypothetical protein